MSQASVLCRSKLLQKHKAFKPAMEAIDGFKYCGIDRFNPPMDLGYVKENPAAFDLQAVTEKSRKYFQNHCDGFGRERFVSKNTANSMRIELLNEIFPEAHYIHISRNPYSVISSLLHVKFWPELRLWWNDKTPRQLEGEGRNKYEIAGTHWSNQIDQIYKAKQLVKADKFLDVAYEDLVTDAKGQIERILNFCDLEYSAEFEKSLDLLNVNGDSLYKWKTVDKSENYSAANPAIRDRAIELGYELI